MITSRAETEGVTRQRRIAAYGICRDRHGRVLLVHASDPSAGTLWLLPGGGVEHGEHPADAVVREVHEETGLAVDVVRPRDVVAELLASPSGSGYTHSDAVIYELAITGGVLRAEVGGSTDQARWWEPAEVTRLSLSPVVAGALAVPASAQRVRVSGAAASPPGPRPRPRRGQRFAAYGLVTDPAGRVLLTLIAEGYPGAGRWHAPGGGTDFGEQPRDGLLREITEETGQSGRIGELLTVSHYHHLAAVGPEGYPIDWHAVRGLFRVSVEVPTTPRVLDPGGSTAAAGWYTRAEAAALPLTDVAADSLALPARQRGF